MPAHIANSATLLNTMALTESYPMKVAVQSLTSVLLSRTQNMKEQL